MKRLFSTPLGGIENMTGCHIAPGWAHEQFRSPGLMNLGVTRVNRVTHEGTQRLPLKTME